MTIKNAAEYHFSFEATPFGGKVVAVRDFIRVVLNLNDEDKTVTFDGTDTNITADAAAPVVLEVARFIRRENVWGMVAEARVRREAIREMRLEDEDRQALEDERRHNASLVTPS
tara:strand:- start:237 stop:578 length:342 start_codon:yes stop_codon:yes gene_type:complete